MKMVSIGEVLLRQFMMPRRISKTTLSEETGVSRELIGNIIKGIEPMNEVVAYRISKYFGVPVDYWSNRMNMLENRL